MAGKAPIVRTLDPANAHPLYVERMRVTTTMLGFAANLARAGLRGKAIAVRDAADAIIAATQDLPPLEPR